MTLRTLWILEYRFAPFYDNELSWQRDYERFCDALRRFDVMNQQSN
jgi:hypothetical protein